MARTSSSSPNRCRASASTSRRWSSSGRIGSASSRPSWPSALARRPPRSSTGMPRPSSRRSRSSATRYPRSSPKSTAPPSDAAARDLLKARLDDLLNDAKLIDDSELVAQAEGGAGGARGRRHRCAGGRRHGDRRERRRGIGTGTGHLGRDAAPARDRRDGSRRRAPRHLPDGSRRRPRRHRGLPSRARGESRRPRGAAHGAPPVPHAEGQRADGRIDRARRARVRRREDPQPPARGGAHGDAGGARDDGCRRVRIPAVDRAAEGHRSRRRRPGEAPRGDSRGRSRTAFRGRTRRAAKPASARRRRRTGPRNPRPTQCQSPRSTSPPRPSASSTCPSWAARTPNRCRRDGLGR